MGIEISFIFFVCVCELLEALGLSHPLFVDHIVHFWGTINKVSLGYLQHYSKTPSDHLFANTIAKKNTCKCSLFLSPLTNIVYNFCTVVGYLHFALRSNSMVLEALPDA